MNKINEIDLLFIEAEKEKLLDTNQINSNFIVEELDSTNFYSFYKSINPDSLIILIVTDGSVEVKHEKEIKTVKYNSVIRIIPEHLIELAEISSDFRGKFISVNRNLLSLSTTNFSPNTYLYIRHTPVISLQPQEVDDIIELFYIIKKKVKKLYSSADEKVFHCLIMALFYELNGCINRQIEETPTLVLSHKENLYKKFLLLLRKHIRKEHSVAFYANQLCLTPQYISSVLKELSGMTANKWIDEMLLAEAKLLLFSTENNIQEIADKLYFPDQSSFGKFFKKMTGMSPTNYRKQKSKGV